MEVKVSPPFLFRKVTTSCLLKAVYCHFTSFVTFKFAKGISYLFLTLSTLLGTHSLKRNFKHILSLCLLFFVLSITSFANNISVSNVSSIDQNTSAGVNNTANFISVQFDLSWENSWRTNSGPSNWDAAWVFVKFRIGTSDPTYTGVNSSGTKVTVSSTADLRVGMPVRVTSGTGEFATNTVISSITNATQFVISANPTTILNGASIECKRIWEHARLNNTGHTAPSGSIIDAGLLTPSSAFDASANPAVGVFIYRNTNGTGTITLNDTRLRWNYGANGVPDNSFVKLQVFAIEMVYVPQSSFHVGSGGIENGSFTDGAWTPATTNATATAVLSSNTVNSINITNSGAGYNTPPLVTISGGGGSGAIAIASVSGGNISSITVTNAGTGYTSNPTVTISRPTTIPFQITSEGSIGIDNAAGKLWGTYSVNTTNGMSIGNVAADAESTLASSYPKGYKAFYCMKYEISQGDYRDFLNTLTLSQQVNRTGSATTSPSGTGALDSTNRFGNGLDIQTPGNATTLTPAIYACNLNGNSTYNENDDGEWRACNYINWMDGCAYMDWAGIRPMTELEYEKACRGDQGPVAGEFAWGNTSVSAARAISNVGTTGEVNTTSGANAVYGWQTDVRFPLRVGAFAGTSTTRVQAGATYYGIMQMSDNVYERAVTIGNSDGRNYTGSHGDGALSSNGHANSATWPGLTNGEVTGASGSGFRGGNFSYSHTYMRISERLYGALTLDIRFEVSGSRGVRSAP